MIPNNTSTIRIGNGDLTYDSYGSGPPLVLVHPEWMNRAVWQPQLETLVTAHQVITYDFARAWGVDNRQLAIRPYGRPGQTT